MTIELHTLADVHKTWALPQLKDAQKAFNKQPTALNWKLCLTAMLVHQQLEYAQRSITVDRDKLLFDLESNPLGQWPEVVCRATLGISCADALSLT